MRGKIRLSPFFVFLLCLLIYQGWGREVGLFLLAALLHECGHLLALTLFGCQTWRVSCGLGGAVIETETMPYAQEFICAAAGPMVNLLLMLIENPKFRLINIALFCYNMLPLASLDGQRILAAVLGLLAPQFRRQICDAVYILTAALLLLGGFYCTVRLPYGKLPIAVVVAILLRAFFFQSEGLDKVRFVG